MGRGPNVQASELVRMLSELAARVQRGRTADAILSMAAEGLDALGMRFGAFQIDKSELVLRCYVTSKARSEVLERMAGRPLCGLRAPIRACAPVAEIIALRENVHSRDLDLFDKFLHAAIGHDVAPLEDTPETKSVCNGVLAPIYVNGEPWGLLGVYCPTFSREAVAAVSLFATHVGTALEVAEFIAELSRTQRELIERERLAAIGSLAATVAHEVRHPVAVIRNAITLLHRDLKPEQAKELRTIIEKETSHLGAIADDLLDFAKPAVLKTEAASLADVVEDVAHAAAARPEARGIDVRLELSPDVPPVSVDTRLVRQALFNLAVNGLQAMPENSSRDRRSRTLTLRTRTDCDGERSYACIDVADTGHGIAEEDEARLFEPFFTTKEMGTGLGLPLVKRVADAHAGEIAFASTAAGTTFTLRMPVEGSVGL